MIDLFFKKTAFYLFLMTSVLVILLSYGCNDKETPKTEQIAPSGLTYSERTFLAQMGVAGKSVTPSVNWNGTRGSFSIKSGAVSGVSIDTATGVISWTSETPKGVHSLSIIATNAAGSTEPTSYTLTVQEQVFTQRPSSSPLYSSDAISGMAGTALTNALLPTNTERINFYGDTTKFKIISPTMLPEGITFNAKTGAISLTNAIKGGVYTLLIVSENRAGVSDNPTTIVITIDAGLPSDDAILPDQYVTMIGKGFDVSWAQYTPAIRSFNEQMVADIKNMGFTNARIRTDLEATDTILKNAMTASIDACLKHGVIPIVAYGAAKLEEATAADADRIMDSVVDWWKTIATRYRKYSHKLSFNLFIEMSGYLKGNYMLVNQLYTRILKEIRAVSPTRIVILPAPDLSDPNNLDEIILPANDNYIMAEWHFYASGPNKKLGGQKQWFTGTAAERKLVTDKIDTAVQWMTATGKKTWVGAWMAGNYNKGNEYTSEEQVRFATFMVRELAKKNIPWSINSDDKFYDPINHVWFNRTTEAGSIAVRDVILDPDKIGIYKEVDYAGSAARLGVGEYNSASLRQLGFYDNIRSLMVPFGFSVEVYTQDDFGGTATAYELTQQSVSGIKSLKVVDRATYD